MSIEIDRYVDAPHSKTAVSGVLARSIGFLGGLLRGRMLLGLTVIGCGLAAVAAGYSQFSKSGLSASAGLIYHNVRRGELPITVVERGNLESQSNVQILCEVDDVRGDNIDGTPILWIIPNGSSVKEGDLIVELDAATHREQLDEQILETEQARAAQIQAKAIYENQVTQNETAKANAELAVKLAELELQMFVDEENGTHQLEVEEIRRAIEDLNNEILAAQANLKLKKNDKIGIETLFKLGYAGKSELERTRLEYLQAESQYAAKMNRMQTQLSTLKKKQSYEHEMQMLDLDGKLETARRNLEQALRNNEAELTQAAAAMDAAERGLKKEEELLARYQEQVKKCKIYAPQDGMVAYATASGRSWLAEVREGAPMRPRQHILSLPNLKSMQVKTAIHESVLDMVDEGLPATIRVDAFPDRVYTGSVKSVAVLPDQNSWSDTKVYETVITIDQEVKQLKPGMTAVVEINVARLKGVISVPVQAIVQLGSDNWCYVNVKGQIERRRIEVGRSNDKFVEIKAGLEQGDAVVLNPSSLINESEMEQTSPSDEKPATNPPEQPAG